MPALSKGPMAFRAGHISSGKGAELLGISELAFVQLLAEQRIDYFTQTPDELEAEVETLDGLLAR